jgi:hypothetical protein
MLNCGHPESHVPRFRVRVDTRRPGDDSRSGCRGFLGLVPQPLFMKSKVCSEEQTCFDITLRPIVSSRCYITRRRHLGHGIRKESCPRAFTEESSVKYLGPLRLTVP